MNGKVGKERGRGNGMKETGGGEGGDVLLLMSDGVERGCVGRGKGVKYLWCLEVLL